MNLLKAGRIAQSGLLAQRVRLNVTASNIANAQVTRTLEEALTRPKMLSFRLFPFQRLSQPYSRSR